MRAHMGPIRALMGPWAPTRTGPQPGLGWGPVRANKRSAFEKAGKDPLRDASADANSSSRK